MRLREIAELVHGELSGDGNAEIARLAKIEDAGPGDITFLANLRYKKFLATTGATAVLIPRGTVLEELSRRSAPLSLIRVADPYGSFQTVADVIAPARTAVPPAGIHPTAVASPDARIGQGCAIGAHVVIGERCTLGAGVILHPGVIIGSGVGIGDGSVLHSGTVVRDGCSIGRRVIVHANTTIGSDGFGFTPTPDGSYEKIFQRGIVVIEDDVEIGANCAIDRASLGETRIRRGAKLDNLIHVAHNVVIGEDTVIAAQTGISGSTKIGRQCQIAGQVGLSGHLTIADRTTIGAQSGVPKSIEEPGETWFGYPAFPIRETLRIQASMRMLPSLLVELRRLEERIQELEQRTGSRGAPTSSR
ncbi:MAG TPA: UDP-3-O-(3-hydroxymyristoyl)glucosamine N-acyltransferase [Bacteroidota bacterium]|nr:UDP-3-O-(3-hydroxymyristoyl)glucosamine N-acyltransferase [Bacteroidota bacterium]